MGQKKNVCVEMYVGDRERRWCRGSCFPDLSKPVGMERTVAEATLPKDNVFDPALLFPPQVLPYSRAF